PRLRGAGSRRGGRPMNDVGRAREAEDLRARVAALEELQEAQEQALLEHTTRLDESLRQLREKTGILESVLASMGDGVVVADAAGKFLLCNPAAERLLHMGATDTPPEKWSERYGCYRMDGVTPYPSEELPLARAIRGEEVNGAEVVVRHEGVPEGIFLSTNA